MNNDKLAVSETYLNTKPAKIFVRTVGKPDAGNVLIIVHGGPGLSHRYLLGLEQLASSHLTLVHYDQRGTGRSSISAAQEGNEKDPTADNFSFKSYVQDLEAVRSAIAGPRKVHILGHSWGGLVAMYYAIQYPEYVRSLSLIGSEPPTSSGVEAGFERLQRRVQFLQDKCLIPTELSTDEREQFQQILPVYLHDPETIPSLIFEMTPGIDEQTWKSVGGFDARAQTAKLQIPLQILFGASEPFGREWADETRDAFTSAQIDFAITPDCGHFGWVERPEVFFPAVRNFLHQHS